MIKKFIEYNNLSIVKITHVIYTRTMKRIVWQLTGKDEKTYLINPTKERKENKINVKQRVK